MPRRKKNQTRHLLQGRGNDRLATKHVARLLEHLPGIAQEDAHHLAATYVIHNPAAAIMFNAAHMPELTAWS
jgi:hypothetical protein